MILKNKLVIFCGEGGIRTPGTDFSVRQFSKLLLSTTQAPLRKTRRKINIFNQKNIKNVPKAGLEPALPCENTPLKRARLPISPLRLYKCIITFREFHGIFQRKNVKLLLNGIIYFGQPFCLVSFISDMSNVFFPWRSVFLKFVFLQITVHCFVCIF